MLFFVHFRAFYNSDGDFLFGRMYFLDFEHCKIQYNKSFLSGRSF